MHIYENGGKADVTAREANVDIKCIQNRMLTGKVNIECRQGKVSTACRLGKVKIEYRQGKVNIECGQGKVKIEC